MQTVQKVVKVVTQEEKDRQARFDARPPLDECLSLHDFEVRLLQFLYHYSSHLRADNHLPSDSSSPGNE